MPGAAFRRILLKLSGEALGPGAPGDRIKVRNTSSRRVVEGVVTEDGGVRVWDPRKGKLIKKVDGGGESVLALAFFAVGYVATAARGWRCTSEGGRMRVEVRLIDFDAATRVGTRLTQAQIMYTHKVVVSYIY